MIRAESEAEQEKRRVLESTNKSDVRVHTEHVKKTSEEHEKAAASHVHGARSTGGSTVETKDDRAAYAKHSQTTSTSGALLTPIFVVELHDLNNPLESRASVYIMCFGTSGMSCNSMHG